MLNRSRYLLSLINLIVIYHWVANISKEVNRGSKIMEIYENKSYSLTGNVLCVYGAMLIILLSTPVSLH